MNCMLDLETMSTADNAAIVSIGAVVWNWGDDPRVCRSFFRCVSLASNTQFARHIDPETVMWWMRQSDDARAALTENPLPLTSALYEFAKFYTDNGCTTLWGNGASFDCTIINSAFKAAHQRFPWSFRDIRDLRTLVNLSDAEPVRFDHGTAHHPVHDCIAQIQAANFYYHSLRGLV